jgi:hypothetical protein
LAAEFLDAVRLRATAWEPLALHPEARALIIPLLLLGAEVGDNLPFGGASLSPDEMEELLENGAQIIPHYIAGIRTFWKEHGASLAPKDGKGGK